jgi:hypothetical protein
MQLYQTFLFLLCLSIFNPKLNNVYWNLIGNELTILDLLVYITYATPKGGTPLPCLPPSYQEIDYTWYASYTYISSNFDCMYNFYPFYYLAQFPWLWLNQWMETD